MQNVRSDDPAFVQDAAADSIGSFKMRNRHVPLRETTSAEEVRRRPARCDEGVHAGRREDRSVIATRPIGSQLVAIAWTALTVKLTNTSSIGV